MEIIDDEAYTAILVDPARPLSGMIRMTAEDVHPPLYYLILRGWTSVFGDSLVALRLPSVILGVACVPLSYWMARIWFTNSDGDKEVGISDRSSPQQLAPLLVAAMVTLAIPLISHATIARMYPLFTIWCILATGLAIQVERKPQRIWLWVALCAIEVAATYTHNYAIYLICSLFTWHLFCFCSSRNSYLVTGSLATIFLVGLAFLPWSIALREQMSEVGRGYWIQPLSASTLPTALTQFFMTPQSTFPQLSWMVLLPFSCILLVLTLWPSSYSNVRWLPLFLLATHALLVVFSAEVLGRSVFAPRYSIHLVPILSCPIAGCLLLAKDLFVRRLLVTWMLGSMIASIGIGLSAYLPFTNEDQTMAAAIVRKVPQDDLLATSDVRIYMFMKYYLRQMHSPLAQHVKLIGSPDPNIGHIPYMSCVPTQDMVPLGELASRPNYWIVHFSHRTIPSQLNLKLVERTESSNYSLSLDLSAIQTR